MWSLQLTAQCSWSALTEPHLRMLENLLWKNLILPVRRSVTVFTAFPLSPVTLEYFPSSGHLFSTTTADHDLHRPPRFCSLLYLSPASLIPKSCTMLSPLQKAKLPCRTRAALGFCALPLESSSHAEINTAPVNWGVWCCWVCFQIEGQVLFGVESGGTCKEWCWPSCSWAQVLLASCPLFLLLFPPWRLISEAWSLRRKTELSKGERKERGGELAQACQWPSYPQSF